MDHLRSVNRGGKWRIEYFTNEIISFYRTIKKMSYDFNNCQNKNIKSPTNFDI